MSQYYPGLADSGRGMSAPFVVSANDEIADRESQKGRWARDGSGKGRAKNKGGPQQNVSSDVSAPDHEGVSAQHTAPEVVTVDVLDDDGNMEEFFDMLLNSSRPKVRNFNTVWDISRSEGKKVQVCMV